MIIDDFVYCDIQVSYMSGVTVLDKTFDYQLYLLTFDYQLLQTCELPLYMRMAKLANLALRED